MARAVIPDGGLRMGTPQARWVLLATVLGSSMAFLDATVVNVALQRIGLELGGGFTGLQWTVNSYTLTLASLILLGGSLGDRFGRRRVFVIGTVWFAAASLLCGLAPDIGTLVAARALQGVGGALLIPGSLALISASFSGPDRAAAVGAWSGLSGVAGAIGPFVGGWLVGIDWRLVFLLNLPLAAVVVAGLGALTYGLTAAGEPGRGPGVWGWVAAGLVALAAFAVIQRRSPAPLVPPELFASRQFSAANAVTLLVYAALGVVFVLLVLHLQLVAGLDPLAAGTALLPVTALMLLFSARIGALAQRIGPRPLLTVGPLVAAGGVLLMARIGPDAGYLTDVLPATAVFGVGLTLLVAPLTATVLDSAPDRLAGAASGVNNAVARAAGLLAVAVVPAVAGLGGTGVEDPVAFADGFRTAMLVCAGLLVAGALVAAVLVRRPLGTAEPGPRQRLPIEECLHCDVSGPLVHPATTGEEVR